MKTGDVGLSARLAEFASSATFADLPTAAVEAAEVSLLDAVGVSIAASSYGEGCAAFADVVIADGGNPHSSVLGFNVRVPAAAAALANGAMAHALDFEDAYDPAPSHPNAQVIPAVLALAEQFDLSGQRLVTAIAVGCDVTCRLATAAGAAVADRGWYPPPIFGALGATAGAANLLGLSRTHTLDALSLAISQATASGEVKDNPQSVVRGVRDSFAAHAAVRAVELARRGVTGFEAPLEGRHGFFATYAGGCYEPSALLDGLGETFAGSAVSYKPWPSCRATHAFIEGALELRSDVAEIASIELVGAPVNLMLAEPLEGKRAPTTAIDAKFSLMFTVAIALVTGEVTLESFMPANLVRADVLELAQRISFVVDDSLVKPSDMSVGRITITRNDGTTRMHEVPTPRGSPSNPMTPAELRAKFTSCAQLGVHPLDATTASRLADVLLKVHTLPHVRAVLGAFFSPAAQAAGQYAG